MKISYELHAQVKNRWNIERVYPGSDKEKALEDAKHLNREPHIQAVKLICETYNEVENTSSEVVVFDTSKPMASEPAPRHKSKPHTPVKSSAKKDAPLHARPQKAAKNQNSITQVAIFAVVIVSAAAILLLVLSRTQALFGMSVGS